MTFFLAACAAGFAQRVDWTTQPWPPPSEEDAAMGSLFAQRLSELRRSPPAEKRGKFIVGYSAYNHHTGKGNYNSQPKMRAFEWESPSRWSVGGASFQNSFHQPCWYAFVGKRFQLKHHSGRFFAKVTGGIVYGYKPPHKDAIPLNFRGYNPAIIPSLGYQYKVFSLQLMVFGRAWGAMPVLAVDLRR